MPLMTVAQNSTLKSIAANRPQLSFCIELIIIQCPHIIVTASSKLYRKDEGIDKQENADFQAGFY
jgi:hypothetical protein